MNRTERISQMGQSPWRTGGSELGMPWVKFDSENDGWGINLLGSGDAKSLTPIPLGTNVIFDWLCLRRGPIQWTPRDLQYLVPYGFPIPDLPAATYKDGISVPVLFEGFPLAKLTNTGAYANNSLFNMHQAYTFAAEAQLGQLPIYATEESEKVWNAGYNQYYFKLRLRLTGEWVDRDLEVFGPALIRPPAPMLPATATRPWASPLEPPETVPAEPQKPPPLPPAAEAAKPPRRPLPGSAAPAKPVPASPPPVPPAPPQPPPSVQAIFAKVKPVAAVAGGKATTPRVLPVP
jgi:hypothetical protein